MENSRIPNDQHNNRSTEQDSNIRKVSNAPHGFEGMNFEQQRGSLKNSDYGGAVKDTRSGRNSSDVSQDELKD